MNDSILIVDDDVRCCKLYTQVLASAGFNTQQASSADEAYTRIESSPPLMVITDVRMPGSSGIELLKKTRKTYPTLPFLLVTAYVEVKDAVQAMKLGAVDYLAKPIDLDEFVSAVEDVLGIRSAGLQADIPAEHLGGIVFESQAMQSVINDAYRVAGSDVNVLILGESGVGKEVISRFIHQCSPRHDNPMVAVNCAAIPGTLLASELFGHMKGAFTGAAKNRQGRFREAAGGTLFLDEIGDMPLELQPTLLRSIETGRILPLGSEKEVSTDFRLLAATNRNLSEAVQEGQFRQDLYYRLNVIAIEIPPIRERKEDILPLARHFLLCNTSDAKTLSRAACVALKSYTWPGNVREIYNAMEHARLLCQTDIISPEHLPPAIRKPASCHPTKKATQAIASDAKFKTLEENEIEIIHLALERTNNNRTHAAKLLGISRRGLIHKLKRFRIS